MTDVIQVFHAALEQARTVQCERDEFEAQLHASKRLNDTIMGKYQQACSELESVKVALGQAQGVASGRMAMIYELSAQLSTLGLFATTIAGEVRRILDKVNEIVPPTKAEDSPPEPPVSTMGPFVVGDADPELQGLADKLEAHLDQEGDSNIPFAPRRNNLLSETVIPSPAFLHRGGSPNGGDGYQRLTQAQLEDMTFREKREWKNHKIIPPRFRRIVSNGKKDIPGV